jgi:hypothetical protein
VADKVAGYEMLERAGAVPRPLIVGVEHVPIAIEADASGRPHARGRWDHAAVGCDTDGPASKGHLAVEAAGQAEHDPELAVAVELRAKGILVVVARHAPAVAHGLVVVSHAVAGGVAEPAHLRPLRHVEPAVTPGEAEHLV